MRKIETMKHTATLKRTNTTQKLALCGMFVSLIIVGAFIKFPTPLVPISMQFAFCLLAGLLLGGKMGATCVLIYIAMGLVGIPVFTAGGGIFYVLKPTFGYMIGFIFAVYAAGTLSRIGKREVKSYWQILGASLVAMLIVYAIGVPYLYLIMNYYLNITMSFSKALMTGFVIFLPTDIMWCMLGSLVAYKLRIRKHKEFLSNEKEEKQFEKEEKLYEIEETQYEKEKNLYEIEKAQYEIEETQYEIEEKLYEKEEK